MAASTSGAARRRRSSFCRSSATEWDRAASRRKPASSAAGCCLRLPGGILSDAGAHGRALPRRGFLTGRLLADAAFKLGGEGRVLAQVVAHVLPSLAEAHVPVGQPGPALFD